MRKGATTKKVALMMAMSIVALRNEKGSYNLMRSTVTKFFIVAL